MRRDGLVAWLQISSLHRSRDPNRNLPPAPLAKHAKDVRPTKDERDRRAVMTFQQPCKEREPEPGISRGWSCSSGFLPFAAEQNMIKHEMTTRSIAS